MSAADSHARNATPGSRPSFPVALRGYDRAAVDSFLEAHAADRRVLVDRLVESERLRRVAEQRAAATERENATLRAQYTTEAQADDGFGPRAEKLLRLAEQEAREMRGSAAREAAELLREAEGRAEQVRHDAERDALARAAAVDERADERAAELQERERRQVVALAATRSALDEQQGTAARETARARAEAAAQAAVVRARAEREARGIVERARKEGDRLTGVERRARTELSRLHDLVVGELGGRTPDPAPTARDPATAGSRS